MKSRHSGLIILPKIPMGKVLINSSHARIKGSLLLFGVFFFNGKVLHLYKQRKILLITISNLSKSEMLVRDLSQS